MRFLFRRFFLPARAVSIRGLRFFRHINSIFDEYRKIRSDESDARRQATRYAAKYLRQRIRRAHRRMVAGFQRTSLVKALSEKVIEPSTPRLAVEVSGGIGDYIIIARFMRDLVAQTGPLTFNVFCQDTAAADWIFNSVSGFSGALSEFHFGRLNIMSFYSVAMSVGHTIKIHISRDLDQRPALKRVVSTISSSKYAMDAPDHVVAQTAILHGRTRENFLQFVAQISYGGPSLPLSVDDSILSRFAGDGLAYVTINNGFDANLVVSGKEATKCYPHTEELVQGFKLSNPDILVVQIGSGSSTAIRSADIQLINRTTLEQAATILKQSMIHIDNEGGLVHVARSLGVKSCVLFGPTSVDYFGYFDNVNIRPSGYGNCWGINKTWMDICPRGFTHPLCMATQNPSAVLVTIAGEMAAGAARRFVS